MVGNGYNKSDPGTDKYRSRFINESYKLTFSCEVP